MGNLHCPKIFGWVFVVSSHVLLHLSRISLAKSVDVANNAIDEMGGLLEMN